MNVFMIGVDKTSIGGMLTVVENYLNNEDFCRKTNLKYIATVIRANKFVKIFTFLKVLPKIIYVIKKGKIDIVHVHMGDVYKRQVMIRLQLRFIPVLMKKNLRSGSLRLRTI